ncbi:hypothetical protein AP057_13660 [Geobacillus sp. Sah69]|nr:hypothetical protein AP057_13660 [Geobacillus sp. Sah69]
MLPCAAGVPGLSQLLEQRSGQLIDRRCTALHKQQEGVPKAMGHPFFIDKMQRQFASATRSYCISFT